MAKPKPNPWLIEAKVIAVTVVVALISVAVTVLNEVPGNAALMSPLPGWLQGVITLAVPPLVTFLSGWATRHSSRPDLEVVRSPTPPNL
jgi:hypothetical protein